MSSVCAVVLNWNGARDTIDCLESLSRQTHQDLRVLVVDNGSTDDSVARIEAWDRDRADRHLRFELLETGDNLGFAGGNNVGIRHAMEQGADHVLVLNNDTVAAPTAIAALAAFLDSHPDYGAATGQIRYGGGRRIWNCGGDLTWFGSREYLYGEQPVELVPQTGWRRITFITGCAALIRSSVLRQHGLYTERFFFGEEDYEYSLRLKRAGVPVASCLDAVIEHRVGTSIDRAAPPARLGRYYLYYLNRFIDMRDHYPRPLWEAWRLVSLAVIVPRLRRSHHLSWKALRVLTGSLLRDSSRLDGVSKEQFETAMRAGAESL